MIRAESRPTGSDRGGDARDMARHNVRVTLHNDNLAVLRNRPFGEVDSVKHLCLVIDRRLWRIEVFRAFVVVAQSSCAETDGCTGHIANRPHNSTAEAVVDSSVTSTDESSSFKFFVSELL